MASVKTGIFLALWVGGVVTGLALGQWQLDRLAWKTDWLARIDQAYIHVLDSKEFSKIKIGCTSKDRTFFVRVHTHLTYDRTPSGSFGVRPRVHEGQFGQYVYTRATLPDGRSLWVIRGFVADGETVPPPPLHDRVILQVRAGEVPADFVQDENHFLTRSDLNAGGISGCDPLAVVGVIEASAHKSDWPRPVGTRPTPPNDHWHYAMFWFSMSAIALVMGVWFLCSGRIRRDSLVNQVWIPAFAGMATLGLY